MEISRGYEDVQEEDNKLVLREKGWPYLYDYYYKENYNISSKKIGMLNGLKVN